jgi:hypothetical protein
MPIAADNPEMEYGESEFYDGNLDDAAKIEKKGQVFNIARDRCACATKSSSLDFGLNSFPRRHFAIMCDEKRDCGFGATCKQVYHDIYYLTKKDFVMSSHTIANKELPQELISDYVWIKKKIPSACRCLK